MRDRFRLLALLGLALAGRAADMTVTVDPARVLRRDADRWIGINLNYIRDADANRAPGSRPLAEALSDLGARWLRYPGGEKSDFHRFAPPPYLHPAPISMGWYAGQAGERLDFDRYIALCRARGAEPHVVVACDSPANTGATWDEQLAHAVGWVRYARAQAAGVRCWEIGNENWHNQTAPATEMAVQVSRFARAMREADPAARIAASGNDAAWWAGFLPGAAHDLDALTVSVYGCWGWKSYDRFLARPEPDLLGPAAAALRAIDALPDPADRRRLQVIVAETNSVDYSPGGWPRGNDLGHALVTFASFGALLQEPRIAAAMLWNTRWMTDAEAPTDQFYALDAGNRLLPSGLAVALWGRHLRRDLVEVAAPDGLRAWASVGGDGAWTVWLLNPGRSEAAGVRLALGGLAVRGVQARLLHGGGSEDPHPVLEAPRPIPVEAAGVPAPLTCPALSVTVVTGGP